MRSGETNTKKTYILLRLNKSKIISIIMKFSLEVKGIFGSLDSYLKLFYDF